MNVSRQFSKSFIGALLLAPWAGYVTAGVVGSQHDLTTGGTAQAQTANTDEVCVFCHTPHGSNTTNNATVPLWNKVLADPTTYTQYSTLQTPSFESTEVDVGSVSLACLSCHDGTQAMDVVINTPGSGGYNILGSEIDPVAIGLMSGTPVPNLEQDLTNDHPISMQYGGGGPLATDADGTFPRANLGDGDFFPPVKETINTNPIWWVDSPAGTTGTREKTDMILYARNDLGTVQPFVECGSCHDPHNDATKGPTTVAFLRIDNTASQICTTCHDK